MLESIDFLEDDLDVVVSALEEHLALEVNDPALSCRLHRPHE